MSYYRYDAAREGWFLDVDGVEWACTQGPCGPLSADLDGYRVSARIGFTSKPIGGDFHTDWAVTRGGQTLASGRLDDWDTSKRSKLQICELLAELARRAVRLDGMERRSVSP